jgi:Carboxypeptidase regulatory-like domain
MSKLTFGRLWIAAAFTFLWPCVSWAQAVANAEIRGTVTDVSGASVPNARIRAVQTETGYVRAGASGADGSYALPNLPVGPYKLEVGAPSFSNYVQSGITLQVGNNVLINVTLQVGAVTQEVSVAADAAMVETQNTAVADVIDQRRIMALPLNGRQATDLILLAGGAAVAPSAAGRFITTHDYPTSVGVSVAGGQANSNNYLLDGADHRDTHSNVNLPFPFPDALQEFSVETGGLSARNGLQAGALVNVVTKSGTNQLHGSLFEFVRNGSFNARNYFAATQDTLRRNQFGGTVGGPVKKDRVFFFAGFQGTRERTAPPQSLAFVPTQATLNGDFSAMASAACQSNGVARTILDPVTRIPFPGNQIPTARFSPPAVALTKNVPISTDPCGRLTYSIPNPNNENQIVTRGDWQQSSKHSIFGRYFVADFDNPPLYDGNLLNTTRAGLQMRSQAAVLGSQYTITPTVTNALHVTYSRLAVNRGVAAGIPNPVSVGVKMANIHPGYIDLAVSNHFTMGGGSNAPSIFHRNQYQVADDLDWIHGRHHLSFGVSYIPVQMNERNVQRGNGTFSFNGSISGEAFADYMLGRPNSVIQQSLAEIGLRQKYVGLYFQDSIKLSPRLNVHFGMRWEPSLPEHDVAGRGNTFSMPAFLAGTRSTLYNNSPAGLLFYGDKGVPRAYANSRYLDFAPRFGLAWDPTGSGKMSIRTSYSIFFDTPESFTARDWANASPWGNQINLTAPAGGFADPYNGYPGGNPFPFPYPPTKDAPFPQQGAYINFPLNLHHPYTQKWTVSVQRQLTKDWLASASYIGDKGTHYRSSVEGNPGLPAPGATLANLNQRRVLSLLNPAQGAYYSAITQLDDGVNTIYNGMKVSLQHRFAQHFTVMTSYTWSHCLQDAQPIGNRLTGNQYQNPFSRNADRGVCDHDLRHNFVGTLIYETPKMHNRAANALLAGWQISFLLSRRSGFPFTVRTGVDAALSGNGQDRPNVVGSPYLRDTAALRWVDPKAFVANTAGTFGNSGYNPLVGPGYFNADSSVNRTFRIHERHRVEMRFEFFNVLNHTNFNAPQASLNSATFGRIQSSLDPRIIQLAAKYAF